MEAIVFNNYPSLIHQNGESAALRVCYLICDLIISAGTSGESIVADFEHNNLRYIDKIKVIEADYRKSGDPMEYEAAQLILMWKAMQKIKYKTPQQIKELKRFEASIDTLYKIIADEVKDGIDKTGLSQLKGLMGDNTLGFIHMNRHDLESEENNRQAASKLLKCVEAQDDAFHTHQAERSVFCLTAEFFSEMMPEKGIVYGYKDAGARDKANCWLQKCFTFPNINLLTALELKTIRRQLEPVSAEFKKQADAWIKICDEPGTGDTLEVFKNKVFPHVASLQAAIAQNDLLKNVYSTQRNDSTIELWMGEIPIEVFWRFYKNSKVIHEPTWNILEQALKTEPECKNRIAVMALHLPITEKVRKQIEVEQILTGTEVKSVRKIISVD